MRISVRVLASLTGGDGDLTLDCLITFDFHIYVKLATNCPALVIENTSFVHGGTGYKHACGLVRK